jgi:hypothetical protein
MRRTFWTTALASIIAVLLSGVIASAQDFHKPYNLGAGGHILLQNISGSIKVTGYPGSTVVVDATKVGRDRDLVQIEDLSSGDRVELRVRYPESCNCDASVNFEVQVPAGVSYNFDRLGSVSGKVDISGVQGVFHVNSVSGGVKLQAVSGVVNATSVSGSVDVEISQLSGTGDMKFSSVSGSVNIKAPLKGIGSVDMSSLSGSLDTDFPIQVQESRPGRSARGTVGSGPNNLHISTVSGKISLIKN